MFDVFGLRDLATHVLVPAVLVAVCLMVRSVTARHIVVRGLVMGILATAAYDLVRFGFLWSGLMDHDPMAPLGQELLFPLNATTAVMAAIGHVVYGAVLGRSCSADHKP
jgi:hypothetical protein